MYKTFIRTWWKENKSWPGGLSPCAGKRYYTGNEYETETEARAEAQEYNRTHKAGRLSRKMEYES